jgi:16S rRNA (guanine527-N7)-methyltransferase
MSEATAATAAILSTELAALGVDAAPERIAVLARFAEELLRWNAKINLTAAKTLDEVVHHIVDSSAIVPIVPPSTQRVIDVGSGGGLPCAVLAILRPEIAVVALEPVHKKHAFLSHAKRMFCPNLDPRAERVEQHADRGYDVATSRATFALAEWLEIGRGLVRPGGIVLGMEGADQTELPPGATRHPYPIAGKTRAIIRLETERGEPGDG